jgi:hypothetical protein
MNPSQSGGRSGGGRALRLGFTGSMAAPMGAPGATGAPWSRPNAATPARDGGGEGGGEGSDILPWATPAHGGKQ